MITSVTKSVKKYLCPVMEKNGYVYGSHSSFGTWEFRKDVNGKRVIVLVDRPWTKTLRFSFRMSGTKRHQHFGIEKEYLEAFRQEDGFVEGWGYHNQKEVDEIIIFFVNFMEKRGFEMVEEFANDPLDLFVAPSVEMSLDLYNNRSKYAEEFFSKYELDEIKAEIVLEKIADELLQLTDKYNIEKNYDTLIRLAAAYGTIFERLGAEWAWNPENGVVRLVKEGIKFPVPSIYPFNIIFHWINHGDGKKKSIEYLLGIDLKSFKIYCDK